MSKLQTYYLVKLDSPNSAQVVNTQHQTTHVNLIDFPVDIDFISQFYFVISDKAYKQ